MTVQVKDNMATLGGILAKYCSILKGEFKYPREGNARGEEGGRQVRGTWLTEVRRID